MSGIPNSQSPRIVSEQDTPGPGLWQMREVMIASPFSGVLYTITRIENRKRVHLEYASNGKPMLWGEASARAAIAKVIGVAS